MTSSDTEEPTSFEEPASFELPISIVRVRGADAVPILNNVTTGSMAALGLGACQETFVTDVRGRTIGHVTVRRDEDGLLLVGAPEQSETLVRHIDKYTIREDASAEAIDHQHIATIHQPSAGDVAVSPGELGNVTVDWLGVDTTVSIEKRDDRMDHPLPSEPQRMLWQEFHDARIHAGFPWWGVDFDGANLPQEVNRDSIAISFTKGCYLGQETVARLDALGQVQKKLVRLSIPSGDAVAGEAIVRDGKPIARLTSVTRDGSLAFAMVRRVLFDPGSVAEGRIGDRDFHGVVLG